MEVNEKYMREALREALLAADKDEAPVGAVVVHGNRIIARAHNLVEALCDATAHAEMQAITAAANFIGGKYLTDCTLYVTVEPCPMCAGACYWAQVGQLVYGAADPKRGYSLLQQNLLHPKAKVVQGLLADECGRLLSDFFKKKRR
ncbi:MAG: nucleoside deaminase [Prevotellaceae bacterium]|jgi:tRNA(adenine34) deaminase|nr:nucleoside deaminase [Prevotellaceae bacterium]